MKILYVGPIAYGSTSKSFYDAFASVQDHLQCVNTLLLFPAQSPGVISLMARLTKLPVHRAVVEKLNNAICDYARAFKPDLTFFYNIPWILPETLTTTRQFGLNFCFF